MNKQSSTKTTKEKNNWHGRQAEQRPSEAPSFSYQDNIMGLQDSAGNQAVSQLLNHNGGGRPLASQDRHWLEHSAGPLPDVSLVNNSQSQATLSEANAHAAAQGNQIMGGPKAFAGYEGKVRLAHEMAHVLQQNSPHLPQASTAQVEADAQTFAQNATAGRQAAVQVSAPTAIAYDKKKIGKGDTVISLTFVGKKATVLMNAADGGTYTLTYKVKHNLPPRDDPYTLKNGFRIEELPDKKKAHISLRGGPKLTHAHFPETVPLTVKTKGKQQAGGGQTGNTNKKAAKNGGGAGDGKKQGGGSAKDEAKKDESQEPKKPAGGGQKTTVPKDVKVPVITITDQKQIEELKKRGLIPVEMADAIEGKLDKQEQLTFEEAITLLNGLNQVIQSQPPEEAQKTKESWLKWAKFIQQHKGQISGKTQAGDKGITVDEMKEIIKKHDEFVGLKNPPAKKSKDAIYDPERRKSWNSLQPWEQKLWEEYTAKYGDTADVTDSSRTDLRITPSVRFSMALRMSTQYMKPGARAAAEQLFNDPLFIGGTIAGITLYVAAWLAPEPLFSKAAAATITIALLAVFSAAEIKNVATAWMRLGDETENAETLAELEAAAKNFGHAIGGTALRVLVMIATLLVGKALPTPKPPPPGGGGLQLAPAGGPPMGGMATAPATAVKVLADGTIAIGPGLGVAAMSTTGDGNGGGKKPEGDKTQQEKPRSKNEPTDADVKKATEQPKTEQSPAPGKKPPQNQATSQPDIKQIVRDLEQAASHIPSNGGKMMKAAKDLSSMQNLTAADKVKAIMGFFRRIGFGTSNAGVVDEGAYFIMYSEDNIYAFKIMKDTTRIWYGKVDIKGNPFGGYQWKEL